VFHEELSEYAGIDVAKSRLEGHRSAASRRAKLVEEESTLRSAQKPNAGDLLDSRMTTFMERINKGERVLEKAQRAESATDRCETYASQADGGLTPCAAEQLQKQAPSATLMK
jgi:hypothetical protein